MGVKSYSRAAAAFSEGALPGPPLLMDTVERDLGEKHGKQPKWHKGDASYVYLVLYQDKD